MNGKRPVRWSDAPKGREAARRWFKSLTRDQQAALVAELDQEYAALLDRARGLGIDSKGAA